MEFYRFEFRVFFNLDWFSHQVWRAQSALLFIHMLYADPRHPTCVAHLVVSKISTHPLLVKTQSDLSWSDEKTQLLPSMAIPQLMSFSKSSGHLFWAWCHPSTQFTLMACPAPFLVWEFIMTWWLLYPLGGACGVMVIIVGNGHGDTSSNPGWDWLHFTLH